MALSAAAIKAAVALATDKRTWKAIAIAVAAALTPLVLIVIVICSMLDGIARHNNAAVDLTFNGGNIPITMPADYKEYILEMRKCFGALDGSISAVESMMATPPTRCQWQKKQGGVGAAAQSDTTEGSSATMRQEENGDSLDSVRIKAVFYALNFGVENLSLRKARAREFVDCFVTYEERTRTVTKIDNEGNEHEVEETYIVAVPIGNLPTVYANVEGFIGRQITYEDTVNITEIHLRVVYNNFDVGADMSLEGGNSTHGLIAEMTKNSEVIPGDGSITSPISGWQNFISSEFGYRKNPTGSGGEGHTGIDLAVPLGTEIHAAQSGKVLFVRYKQTGYGHHVAIDHGGGLVTLYAHCSEILVTEGQAVGAGEVIAKSGSTGRSTGPHLHFEVIRDGVPMNPRGYLS